MPEATIRNFRIVQIEGTREIEREVSFYNLDVIISVGYRVKSQRGTQFRIWATIILHVEWRVAVLGRCNPCEADKNIIRKFCFSQLCVGEAAEYNSVCVNTLRRLARLQTPQLPEKFGSCFHSK